MRVTHVITRLCVGGAQENTISTVLGLAQIKDVKVDLISGPTIGPEGSLERLLEPFPGILSVLPSLVRPVRPWSDLRAFSALKKQFQKDQVDLVHTHSGKAGVVGRLAARSAGVPCIIHTIHGPSFGDFQGRVPNLVFTSAEKIAARATTHFIVVANAMRDQYLRAGIGKVEDYSRVFSGFNLAPFLNSTNDLDLRQKLGISPEDIVIGTVARLFELKGHDDLIDIAPALIQKHPRVKFLFVGDGALRSRFEQRITRAGLQAHFVFTGLVKPSQVSSHIGIMDILAHLSRREGLPRALPQALAARKPVVAYRCDGAPEVCLENETGFLITPGDYRSLLSSLDALCSDPLLRTRLGANGHDFVKDKFAVDVMVDSIYTLYRKLLKTNP